MRLFTLIFYWKSKNLTMSSKRKKHNNTETSDFIGKKVILDKLKSGNGSISVAREFRLNESTIRSIKKNEISI